MEATGNSGNPGGGAGATLDKEAVVAAYSRWAPVYDAVFGVQTRAGRRAVHRVLNPRPAGRILEAGVGTGLSLAGYDKRHRVVGIDLSPEMLAHARKRVARRHLGHIEALEVMDAGYLAFPDESFDAIAAMYLMTVVPDPDRVMDEFVRVTKPGGLVLFVNHFASTSRFRRSVERWLSRFSSRIGWHPDVPMERFTRHPRLRLIDQRTVGPAALFTLLVFERI